VQKPGSQCVGLVTPLLGSAKYIKESILSSLKKENIAIDKLVAVGCDGTNVNT